MKITKLTKTALTNTLIPISDLSSAIHTLGFIQADPIRSPAKAEDLILRHRVSDYQAGDLEKQQPELEIEEDFLYAYGYMPPSTRALLFPQKKPRLTKLDKDLLTHVQEQGQLHPQVAANTFQAGTSRNPWGGRSQKTKLSLDKLHHAGHLRVGHRENSIRVYEPYIPPSHDLSRSERLEELIIQVVNIFQPIHTTTLNQSLYRIRRLIGPTKPVIDRLLKQGRLRADILDDQAYISIADSPNKTAYDPDRVYILAPFDPIVWDRLRFEHLWGWPYRFEAYTPKAKRIRGYYAMPILWHGKMIGWANLSVKGNELVGKVGYQDQKPNSQAYKNSLDQELRMITKFLEIDQYICEH